MSVIIDIIEQVVAKVSTKLITRLKVVDNNIVAVNFDHGHYKEMSTTLARKEDDPSLFNKKYPLVALFEDIREVETSGVTECSLTIVICFSTQSDYRSKDRYDKVITPILEPIYKEFKEQLLLHPRLIGYDIPNKKVNRPYWGVEEKNGNVANIFPDVLDAIEISNLKLKYINNNC